MSDFANFIRSLLIQCELSDAYIDKLLDTDGLREFKRAFTHKSIDLVRNYEFYEILGDAITNYITVKYYHKKFGALFDSNNAEGNMGPVAIMARLKINGVSKRTYSRFAEELGFWPYIQVSEEQSKSKTKLLEDVFEAFVGCTDHLINSRMEEFCGIPPLYYFMQNLMDKVEISIDRESLYDQKSLLNEDISKFKHRVSLKYNAEDTLKDVPEDEIISKERAAERWVAKVILTDAVSNKVYTSPPGYGYKRNEAEQAAAKYTRSSGILKRLKREIDGV